MKHLTYQLIIATVIYSLLSVKFIVCNSENNGKIKAKNAEYNYEDNEMIGNDEDLNEDYGNDDDLEAVVAENENQSKQQDDTDLNNNNNNNKQTESNRLSEIYVSLKKANLNIYRKLSVNDMLININEDENESNNNNLIIKAYYKDDVQYDCELPEEYDSIEAFDWSVNGYMTGMNESSYNIILDKKIDSKNAFLNVSCMFKVLNHSDFFYIHFPIVYLGNFLRRFLIYKTV
jgi:hypothetical protein